MTDGGSRTNASVCNVPKRASTLDVSEAKWFSFISINKSCGDEEDEEDKLKHIFYLNVPNVYHQLNYSLHTLLLWMSDWDYVTVFNKVINLKKGKVLTNDPQTRQFNLSKIISKYLFSNSTIYCSTFQSF